MARSGRPGLPREAQVAFWDGIRRGWAWRRPRRRPGLTGGGWRWLRAAGGVKGNGAEGAVSGRFLRAWEREEIAVGLAQGLSCREIAARLAPGRARRR